MDLNKMITWTLFRKIWLVNICIYLVVYTIWTFVMWEFRNPFQWIIDIPTYNYEHRGMGLFAFALYYFFLTLILSDKEKERVKKLESDESN